MRSAPGLFFVNFWSFQPSPSANKCEYKSSSTYRVVGFKLTSLGYESPRKLDDDPEVWSIFTFQSYDTVFTEGNNEWP